jgi:hypothetical protein
MKICLLLPITLSLAAAPALAADDVTMTVLDDVHEVDAVVRALLRDATAAPAAEHAQGSSRLQARAPAETPIADAPEIRAVEPLTAILDREEESEGEIEDFDIPEDLAIPAEDE